MVINSQSLASNSQPYSLGTFQVPLVRFTILNLIERGIHLVAWEKLAKPKMFGSWGIKNIFWARKALAMKSLWKVIFDQGLWGKVIRSKYLKKIDSSGVVEKSQQKRQCKF